MEFIARGYTRLRRAGMGYRRHSAATRGIRPGFCPMSARRPRCYLGRMTFFRSIPTLAALALLGAACTKRTEVAPTTAAAPAPVAPDAVRNAAGLVAAEPYLPASAAGASEQPVRWVDLDRHGFAARDLLLAGIKQLGRQVDDQVAALKAQRAAMAAGTDTRDWDFAMKEMDDARSYLRSMGDAMVKADAATWDQQKAKVGLAWERTQDAYGKVKSSTTG